ncbi:hypothetical protein [Bacillus sp. S14(2024)]|uniref:hypothetical protein n=1 Tax=Bacillus sp. S14(2024) TaxID=3162884 RepID=UPI003D2392F6
MLLGFLILAIFATVCGILAPLSTIWIELSALLMGIATSILLPLYTTIQYHEKHFYERKMKLENYVFALLTAIILVSVILFTAHSHYSGVAFFIYHLSQEYSFLKEREGHSPVSRWEMNWLRIERGLRRVNYPTYSNLCESAHKLHLQNL